VKRALLAAALLAACGRDPGPRAAPPDAAAAAPVEPAPAAPPPWIGVIASAEVVDVAPPFEGMLDTVAVRPGDVVAAGQVLARLDDRPLREELAAAKAAVREARARAPGVEVDLARARHRVELEERSVAEGTSAQVVLDEARFALERAVAAGGEVRAAIAQAQTRVDRAQRRLAEAAVRAPFAGTVGARYQDPGAAVGPETPIARVIGGAGVRLRFAVLPEEARALAPGHRVIAEVDTLAAPIGAVVEQIAPEVDQASQLVFVDAALDAGAVTGLQPGLAARVRPGTSP
jgi:membrane fusion protein (multidrug efflux system)/multidrug efflux system membrane fusion protein